MCLGWVGILWSDVVMIEQIDDSLNRVERFRSLGFGNWWYRGAGYRELICYFLKCIFSILYFVSVSAGGCFDVIYVCLSFLL